MQVAGPYFTGDTVDNVDKKSAFVFAKLQKNSLHKEGCNLIATLTTVNYT